MKKSTLGVFAIAFALVSVSCTTNETQIEETSVDNLLNSYTVKRDASGAYSLNYNLAGDAASELVKDTETNTNEIYLYSSDAINTKRSHSEDLSISKDQLSVGFVDTNTDRKNNITIIDSDIVLSKDGDDDLLAEYSITGKEDGTYDLTFKVDAKVEVDFVYNEDEDLYEIHLEEGKGKEVDFSRTFTKEEGVNLNIDFINHFESNTSKGLALVRKPRAIIKE